MTDEDACQLMVGLSYTDSMLVVSSNPGSQHHITSNYKMY